MTSAQAFYLETRSRRQWTCRWWRAATPGSFAASGCGCHDGNLWSSERVRRRGHCNASRSCAGSINELLGSARRRDNHSRLGGASNRCRRGVYHRSPGRRVHGAEQLPGMAGSARRPHSVCAKIGHADIYVRINGRARLTRIHGGPAWHEPPRKLWPLVRWLRVRHGR